MVSWKEFENKPTLELIELIRMRVNSTDIEIAHAAFCAFTFRFLSELTKKTEIISKNWGLGKDFAEQVIQGTFEKFWKYPKFDIEKSKSKDVDTGVLLYLLRIAQNVMADIWNIHHGRKPNPYDGTEHIIWDYPDHAAIEKYGVPDSRHAIIVKKALSTLSEKHKIIYLTYTAYERNGYKLPRMLLSKLRDDLNISQQTIRSYKNEAVNKINEYLGIYEKK